MIYALLFDGYRLVMTAYSQRGFLWKIRILKHPFKGLIEVHGWYLFILMGSQQIKLRAYRSSLQIL